MRMTNGLGTITLAAGLALATGCTTTIGEEGELPDIATLAAAGNGGPAGAHYSLNIIGVAKGKTADMTTGSGHRIFVPEAGTAKINLSEGDFQVLDGNGTDGIAAFQLPNPDPDGDLRTSYSVFARALGKPGGSSTTTTCGVDKSTGEIFCSVESAVLVRTGGRSTFTNVSRELLSVSADLDGDGDLERTTLFSSALDEYYWEYDNAGLKLAQLRFYAIPTAL